MKKFFSMALLALTTLTMSAQEDSKFTLKAGLGLSSIVGDDADGAKSKFAYKVGATYDFNIGENFAIVPGVELVAKGFEYEGISGSIDIYYLQVPVLAAYKFNVSDNMKLSVKAGPYVSYGLFGSDIDIYGFGSVNIFDDEMYDRFDAGVAAGLTLNMGKFSVGVEYSRGLMKLADDSKTYNQAYGLVLGYKF
ncbi:MAG: porin family protein [Bacteroidaceae bacterium]|nr:porin family protein [Bacteroidaceae bacterium]